ncbi:ubiquitin hydrolase, partial [Trypanosoma cruzi]
VRGPFPARGATGGGGGLSDNEAHTCRAVVTAHTALRHGGGKRCDVNNGMQGVCGHHATAARQRRWWWRSRAEPCGVADAIFIRVVLRSVKTERPPTPRRDTWGADGREEADGSGLRVASHALTMGVRPRARDCGPRHAQLLSLEREQHRVVTDRLYQKVQKLSLKWAQEREAHASTTLLLFKTQMEVCILQEESARHAIAAAEAEDRIGFTQLEGSREPGGIH